MSIERTPEDHARFASDMKRIADNCVGNFPAGHPETHCQDCGRSKEAHRRTRHAPGPWKINLSAAMHHDSMVAMVFAPLGRNHIGIQSSKRSGKVRNACEANARLIAAAPELLEALFVLCHRSLGNRITEQGRDNWVSWAEQFRDHPKVDRALLAAIDAIAKAEGRAE